MLEATMHALRHPAYRDERRSTRPQRPRALTDRQTRGAPVKHADRRARLAHAHRLLDPSPGARQNERSRGTLPPHPT